MKMAGGDFDRKDVVEALERHGWAKYREASGDHEVWRHPTNGGQVILRSGGQGIKINMHTVKLAADRHEESVTEFLTKPVRKVGKRPSVLNTPARRKAITWLYEQPDHQVKDDNGYAGGFVAQKLGYVKDPNNPTHGLSACSALFKSMADDGQIERVTRGKRTYLIKLNLDGPRVHEVLLDAGVLRPETVGSPSPETTPEPEAETPPLEAEVVALDTPIDLQVLADQLLSRVVGIVAEGGVADHRKRWESERDEILERLSSTREYAKGLKTRLDRAESQLQDSKKTIERLIREKQALTSNVEAVVKANGKQLPTSLVKDLERQIGVGKR